MDFAQGPQIGATFAHKSAVSSLSFHDNGIRLFAATEADSRLYQIDAQNGKSEHIPLKCEKEGISQVVSTHHDHCVLFAGTKGQHSVHYWSVYDNKILRKFRGHSDKVVSVAMSPANDFFLTASKDSSIRLWKLQQAGCVGLMELPKEAQGSPSIAFDSTGMVFAVIAAMTSGQGNYVHLYDAQNFTGGAFSEMKVSTKDLEQALTTHSIKATVDSIVWKSIAFNGSGNQMLVQAEPGLAIILDGYEGTIQRIFESQSSKGTVSCFTPDDKFVLLGTEAGTIEVYNVQSGALVKSLTGHLGPVTAITCNPKFAQIASSCTNTCLWIW